MVHHGPLDVRLSFPTPTIRSRHVESIAEWVSTGSVANAGCGQLIRENHFRYNKENISKQLLYAVKTMVLPQDSSEN